MPTQELPEPLKNGTMVKIRDSGYPRAKVVEYRGALGPRGARVYRLMLRRKPSPVYVEVLEEQIEVLQ